MTNLILHYSTYIFALLALTIACDKNSDPVPDIKPDPDVEVPVDIDNDNNNNNSQQAPSGGNSYLSRYASRLEVPALNSDNLFIQHSTLFNGDSVMTYCLEYNREKCHSRWVAFRFDGITRAKNTKRNDSFQDDPALPVYYQIGSYSFKGYDRGHLCASADRLYSPEANQQTFYMTNMSPQFKQFNQDYWVKFENHVQGLGHDENFADTLYVVKGGTIADDMVLGSVLRSNGAEVVVPAYYFMALLKLSKGKYQAMAFYVEHKSYEKPATRADLKNAVISIDDLEMYTGIDFFHNLPDDIEKEVEASFKLSAWKLN